jgi:nicotinate-nucleotide adenylyltransferase
VSKLELELPEKRYSVETLGRINADHPDDEIFFVMGADSWMEIKTWREWEKVLLMVHHVVMTRPGTDIDISHVTKEISDRIVDVRGRQTGFIEPPDKKSIFITDLVNIDLSATGIRHRVRGGQPWHKDVPPEVAIYIEKYQIYN